jgi:long-chain acyl-CoA synthetase
METLDQPGLFYTDMIANNAKYFAAKAAVICGDDQLTWAEFHKRTNKVANALLARGLKKGDKVCLLMQSSIPMFELLWGTIKAGGVIAPLNVMMAQDSLAGMINNSDARLVFVDPTTAPQVEAIRGSLDNVKADGLYCLGGQPGWQRPEPMIDAAPDSLPDVKLEMSDSMNIIYSSGSTGVPKGIEHSHFARHAYSCGFGPGMKMDRFTVSICSTPLYTNGTWITMLPTVYWGGTVVLMPKFTATGFFEAVQKHRCTHIFMVPTQFIVLLESPDLASYDLSSLKCLLSGGQPLAGKTAAQLEERIPGAGLYECYGMTEGFITIALPEDKAMPGKRTTVGMPMFGGDIIILGDDGKVLPNGEIGEIAGWGPPLMKGYYKDPQRTADMIWRDARGRSYIKSGDLGRMDEDGYLYVAGRTKDMIKSGGINVFASDIEDVFMQHPDVMEAAAVGVPHEKWVETPLLLAILREGATVTETALKEWGNAKLGKFQRVDRVEFRKEFPRATHDKVLKRALRDPYWEGHARKP